jgi:hypothetical protein
MKIDCNEQNSKQHSPIRFNLDPDSNEIDGSSKPAKYDLHRVSSERAMQTELAVDSVHVVHSDSCGPNTHTEIEANQNRLCFH